ncbi:MAG TPA: FmdB family zinc ribbon protein [Actinomycetota bacterium]|jgi:putative FmdB family regulatory protein
MPTYEYACQSCGSHIEVYQRFSDEPLSTCGVCGGQLRKVFHPAGILFKGSGFYATDSRAAAKKSAGDGKSSESGGGDKGSPGSKETKETKAKDGSKSSGSKDAGSSTASSTPSKEKTA